MNVVVLAPHADDEVLGCGGTIAKLVERNYDVFVYCIDKGLSSAYEFNKSCLHLGAKAKIYNTFHTRYFTSNRQDILERLVEIRNEIEPRMVFLPACSDVHQDHGVIYQEGKRAFKHSSIYGYELFWNSFTFANQCYSVLSPDHLQRKLDAMTMYESQKDKKYFDVDNIVSLAKVRGVQANSEFAECFEVIRQFL